MGWKQTGAGVRTYYLYDSSLPVAELNGSGSVTAIKTFGAAGLVSRNVTGTGNTPYAFDERGNVAPHTRAMTRGRKRPVAPRATP